VEDILRVGPCELNRGGVLVGTERSHLNRPGAVDPERITKQDAGDRLKLVEPLAEVGRLLLALVDDVAAEAVEETQRNRERLDDEPDLSELVPQAGDDSRALGVEQRID
jgi:hypothetical protein